MKFYYFLLLIVLFQISLAEPEGWAGKVYYQKYGSKLQDYKTEEFTLVENIVKFASHEFNLKDLQYECYADGSGYPCDFNEFLTQRGQKYAAFKQDTENFLKRIPVDDCLVLEFSENRTIFPWYICPETPADLVAIQQQLKNNYEEYVQKMPLEDLPDDVKPSAEFKLDTYIEEGTSVKASSGSFFVQKNQLENSDFKPVVEYAKIDPIDNWRCGIELEGFELPSEASHHQQSCCMAFDTNALKHVYCSNNQPFCTLEIRRLARYMKISCLLHHHNASYDPSQGPTPETLEKFDGADASKGKWEGWGYYWSVSSTLFHSEQPFYFKIHDDKETLSISANPDADPQAKIQLKNLKSSDLVSLKDFEAKEAANEAVTKGLEGLDSMLLKTGASEEELKEHCYVFETSSQDVLCLHEPEAAGSFVKAVKSAHQQAEESTTVSQAEPLSVKSKFKGVVFIMKEKKFEGEVVIGENELDFVGSKPALVMKYQDVDAINGDACAVKLKDFSLNEGTFEAEPTITAACCIEIISKSQQSITICMDKAEKDCEGQIVKVASRIRKSCMGNSLTQSQLKDYEEDTDDQHKVGVWRGWVYHAELSGASAVPSKGPRYLDIDALHEEMSLYQSLGGKLQMQGDLHDVTISCETENPCSIDEYAKVTKLAKLDERLSEEAHQLGVNDPSLCFIIEFRTNDVKAHLICAVDVNQNENLRNAITIAYEKTLETTEIDNLPIAQQNDEFNLTVWTQLKGAQQYKAKIAPEFLVEAQSNAEIVKYSEIGTLYGFKCGLEFRNIKTEAAMQSVQPNSQACFVGFFQTQKHEFCIEDKVRPVLKARKLMKKMHSLCIESAVEAGEVNEALLKTQAVEENNIVTGGAASGAKASAQGDDKDLKSDPENGAWSGNVFYMKLGESVTMSSPEKGVFQLKDKQISFKSDDGTYNEFNVLELYFVCKTIGPCLAEKFIKTVSTKISPLLFHQLTKSIQKFVQQQQITVMDSCTVLSYLDPYVAFRTDLIICTKQADQGNEFRRAIEVAFDKETELVQPEDEAWQLNIPKLYVDNEYSTYVIAPKVGDFALRTIHFDNYKIFKQHQLDIQIRYRDIDVEDGKCRINVIPEAIDRVDEINGLELADKNCCWSYFSKQVETIVCQQGTIRCQIDKKQQLKQIIQYCQENLKNQDEQNQNLDSFVPETFEFGIDEIYNKVEHDTKLPTGHENHDYLIKQATVDPVNGQYQGYVYHQSMTSRDQNQQVDLIFLSVDKDNISFYKNHTDEAPIYQFKSSQLSFPCQNDEYASNPTEYAECYSHKVKFVAKQRLLSTILSYTVQTPMNDPKQCIVFDVQQPTIRSVQSQFICTLTLPETQDLKEAIANSNYMSLEQSKVVQDIPMIYSENELFDVRVYEEGNLQDFKASFSTDGIQQSMGKGKSFKSVYEYKEVAPDSIGENCAVWYQNIIVPKDMDLRDPNCCFVFKKAPDSMVTVCSLNENRCLLDARMMLKKFHNDCKVYFSKNDVDVKAPSLPSSKGDELPKNNLDIIDLDVNNGIYKGRMWVFKMLQDLPFSETPWFIDINSRDKIIDVFPDPETHHPMTGEKNPTVMEFSLLNMLWPCGSFVPCSPKNFQSYFSDNEQDSDKIEVLKGEIDKIKEVTRNPEIMKSCIFVQFKHEAGPETVALCVTDETYTVQFSMIIAQAFDVAALMADVNLQVGEASTEDRFKITYYDGSQRKITVQLGNLALQDDTNNAKVMDYVDIQDDKFGTPCAFWYRFITLPDVFQGYEKQCCFAFVVEDKERYICMTAKTHCQVDSLVLMKSMRQGCLNGEKGANLSTGESVNGYASREEGTEVVGESMIKGLKMNDDQEEDKQIWNVTNLSLKIQEENAAKDAGFPHATAEGFEFNPTEFLWKGWMLVGELPLEGESLKTPETEFVKITADSSKRLSGEDEKAVEIESSPNQYLVMKCAGGMCIPSDFLTQMKEGPAQSEFRFSETRSKGSYASELTEKQIGDMTAKIGDELFCRVMEHVIDGKPRGRNYCVIMGDKSMINGFAGNLMEISSKIGEVMPISAAPELADGQELQVEYYTDGDSQSEIKTVVFGEESIDTTDGQSLLKYTDVEKCWMCYHLVEPITVIKAEVQCCAKFSISGAQNFICSNEPSEQCSGPLKQILRKVYNQCKASSPDAAETMEPMTCGTDEEYKEEAEKIAEKLEQNSPEATEEEAQKLLEDLLANMPQSGADQTAAEIATVSSIINSLTTVSIVSTTNTVNGLLITFSDGSTSLQKSDGSTVITYNDGTVIIINTNNTVTIMNSSTVSTLNTDSSMTSVNTNTNTASTVSNTGDISSSSVVDNQIVNTSINKSGQTTTSINTDQNAVNNLNTLISTATSAMSETNSNNISSKMNTLNSQMNTASTVMNVENKVANEVNNNSANSQSIANTATQQNSNVNTNMATVTNNASTTNTNNASTTNTNNASTTNTNNASAKTTNNASAKTNNNASSSTTNNASSSSSTTTKNVNNKVSKSIQNQINNAQQANFNKHIAQTQKTNNVSKNIVNKNVVNNVNNKSTSTSTTSSTNTVNGKPVKSQPGQTKQQIPGLPDVEPETYVTSIVDSPKGDKNSKQPKKGTGKALTDDLSWEANIIKISKRLNSDFQCEGPSSPIEDRF